MPGGKLNYIAIPDVFIIMRRLKVNKQGVHPGNQIIFNTIVM